jgi:hypothetical protein
MEDVMSNKQFLVLMAGMVCLMWVGHAFAQTPLDTMFTGIRSSMIIWGGSLVAVLGVLIGAMVFFGVHLGPMVIMYTVLGFIGTGLIGSAASGQLGQWMGLP